MSAATALERARGDYEAARAASEAATPGGLHGDPAVLVRVNRSTVTVRTAWSWDDRIAHARIIETKQAAS